MMNPSSWCNPPPPGTDMEEESKHSITSTSTKSFSGSIIDQIDPFIKNPEYIKYRRREKSASRHRRSRSHSFDRRYRSRSREKRRKKRSRSRSSKTRSKRSKRSRSRERRRHSRKYSHSSSRSRSPNREKSKKSKKHGRRRRSRSRSHSRSRRYHSKSEIRRRGSTSPANLNDSLVNHSVEEEEDDVDVKENAFKNDGSFLEMFKKMQEEKAKTEPNEATAAENSVNEVKKVLPAFGKRRGGRILKTGLVEKPKITNEEQDTNSAQDPWSMYLKEVKRYKEACCDDDSKTRPLVK